MIPCLDVAVMSLGHKILNTFSFYLSSLQTSIALNASTNHVLGKGTGVCGQEMYSVFKISGAMVCFCYQRQGLGLLVRKSLGMDAGKLLRIKSLLGDLEFRKRQEYAPSMWGAGRSRGGCAERTKEGFYFYKIRLQREQVESCWSWGLLHPQIRHRAF